MKLTCAQMDVLISFYLEDELSSSLKKEVEKHIKNCITCRDKYDIIKTMIGDLKNNLDLNTDNDSIKNQDYKTKTTSSQYKIFKNNLSAYIDNELTDDENIKIKKYTINNLEAKQDLKDNYSIKKIMNDSYKKTKTDTRLDFSRSVLRQLELDEDSSFEIHPAIKILICFTITVLVVTALVLMSLST